MMDISITVAPRSRKYWFYLRKGVFQVFFPILLGFMSFCDYFNHSENINQKTYNHLYFYTSLILLFYASARYILEFIFSMCSEEVIFKKEMNINHTVSDIFLSTNLSDVCDNHVMIITKKIFKIRYSQMPFFIYVDKICWFLGIDSPILISEEIINKLSNVRTQITDDNEEIILHSTLTNLSKYHPKQYNIVPVNDASDTILDIEDNISENNFLLPRIIITKLDKSINEMQMDLFNRKSEAYEPNV